MEETITVQNSDKEENIINKKSINLIDIDGDTSENVANISNILRTNTQSMMDNSSANIIDILGDISLDQGQKITSAIIPIQVFCFLITDLASRKSSRIC